MKNELMIEFIKQIGQALQIAENQLALQFAGKPCEQQAVQNALKFTISCQSEKVEVRYPLGKVEITP